MCNSSRAHASAGVRPRETRLDNLHRSENEDDRKHNEVPRLFLWLHLYVRTRLPLQRLLVHLRVRVRVVTSQRPAGCVGPSLAGLVFLPQ